MQNSNEKLKLFEIVLYICDQIPKFQNGYLKVNKLLWFIESEFYRQKGRTITGVEFVAIDHGPVVDNYKKIFEEMASELGLIDIQHQVSATHSQYLFSPCRKSDLSILDADEKCLVEEMVQGLGKLSSNTLENMSHQDAYLITVSENKSSMGKKIDMELVLLETNPLEEEAISAISESEREEIEKTLNASTP